MDDFFPQHPWLGIALCALAYISDYYLTIYSARLYQARGKDHFGYSGSMELTPYFQQDVDHLRMLSPRFAKALAALILLPWLFWWLVAQLGYPQMFAVLTGALLLREAPIHLRHARNIALYRSLRSPGSVTGRVEYSRVTVYRLSAIEMAGFALLFLLLALPLNFFFLGGALGCGLIGMKHWQTIRTATAPPPPRP